MSMDASQTTQLVTVATESFVPGACVMFASFLRFHPDFQGQLITITDGLSNTSEAALRRVSPRIRIVPAGQDLIERIARLADAIPGLSETSGRFLSLEVLRPSGAERVLFCDSDTLFLGPIHSMFDSKSDVIATGDGCFLRGQARDAVTLAEVERGPGRLNHTFNAGVMLFGQPSLTGDDFSRALTELSELRFNKLECGLHDQAIYNLVFADRVRHVDWSHNYLLKHRMLIERREPVVPRDIRVLHFNQRTKPWNLSAEQIALFRDPFFRWATMQWRSAAERVGTDAVRTGVPDPS
ncbi:glycosyltransferase [uncultured Parasphingorhabdus sp.]|uniref:glycosyltransferase family 8 protein n=1 Tax=uncultured Parasphingorhabdus sp. TaxID=2709694 RepID=UPI002AA826BE|nr:glycosyltransferase [uncultured Parasphingorhabdus sp.]